MLPHRSGAAVVLAGLVLGGCARGARDGAGLPARLELAAPAAGGPAPACPARLRDPRTGREYRLLAVQQPIQAVGAGPGAGAGGALGVEGTYAPVRPYGGAGDAAQATFGALRVACASRLVRGAAAAAPGA